MKFKLNKLKILLLAVVGLLSGQIMAQTQYTGTVTDGGETLIGATVIVKGATGGTVTDIDGNFSITANPGDVLEVSYTGFENQEITLGGETTVNVILAEGISLGEVVVTGYSVDSRRSTPGSVSTIESKVLGVTPSGNVEQQLQGKVAGVTVITNGQPGTSSQVRVRGYGALGGNAPLYVVDGVPVDNTDFLAPDDIETTTVLKDATAASIYGARAAGGVIVYTTKRGTKKNQPLKVTYNGMTGITTPGTGAPILNPQDHADWTWKAIENGARNEGTTAEFNHPQFGSGASPVLPDYLLVGGSSGVSGNVDLAAEEANYNVDPNAGDLYQVVKANPDGTDWYDEITRDAAVLHRHNLGFSGGSEKSRFYVGLGMQEQDGILNHQTFSRYNMRINTEFDLMPGLRIGQNLQGTYRATTLLLGDGAGTGSSDDENVVLAASRMASIIPVFDEFGGYAGTAVGGFNNPANPVAFLDGAQNDKAYQTMSFGNVYLEAEPMKNLVLRTSFGGRFTSTNTKAYSRRTYENQENNASFGYSQFSSNQRNWVWTNTANYKTTVGSGKLDVLVGQEALSLGVFRNVFASGINPFSEDINFVNISTLNDVQAFGDHSNGVTFASYFGRVNYDLMDKYIVSVVVRQDGSSRFGEENRNGIFPAVSAAWRISSEDFMSGNDIFDDLKIRAGYGIMGNSNNVDPNNQFSLYGTTIGASSYDVAGSNTSAAQGFYRTRVGNPLAQWERAITSNIGIDALLGGGKWDVGLEFWRKDTEDLLFQQPVTVMTGTFAAAPSVNVGEMRNQGIDFTVINKGRKGNFSYTATLTGGFLDNEIVALSDGIENLPNRSSAYRGITPVLNQVGQPLSAFYGYEVQGIFADANEVTNAPTQDGAAPGRFRFADLDGFDDNGELTGVPDGKIDLADRTVLGSPIPDFTGGLNFEMRYKNIGAEIYSYASIGNEVYNISKLFTDFYPLFPGAAISERVKDSWSFDNPTGDIPLFETASNFSTNTQSNSFYVEDGSFWRLQNVTLHYYLPASLTNKWNIGSLRVSGGVNNLLTITGYEGLDPSVGGAADTNFGVDLGNVPLTRSWTLGVNAEF